MTLIIKIPPEKFHENCLFLCKNGYNLYGSGGLKNINACIKNIFPPDRYRWGWITITSYKDIHGFIENRNIDYIKNFYNLHYNDSIFTFFDSLEHFVNSNSFKS